MCEHKLCQCDCMQFSMDSKTPFHVHLSAFYKRSYAFFTIKERIPVILTRIIDNLVRDKNDIAKEYGEESREEIKAVIGEISKLKYECLTNKPLEEIIDSELDDADAYNRYLNEQSETDGTPRYFTAIWLHVECYVYRKLRSVFVKTTHLKDFDPFRKQKEESYKNAEAGMISVADVILPALISKNETDVEDLFKKLIKINLWSNKCDLSHTGGVDTCSSEKSDPLSFINNFNENVLVDNTEDIWQHLSEQNSDQRTIEFVNDNAGYEMFTDFLLADFLMTYNLADKIVFNIKAIPWFISDTTTKDFRWLIRMLINHENPSMKKFGIRWNKYIRENIWTTNIDSFWTMPFDFTQMKSEAPELYQRLSEAKLVIFKGDLNYRKLFGEINWEPSTPAVDAVQGFLPTALCSLRTCKADMVCGLPPGKAKELDAVDPDWMVSGNYAVVTFIKPSLDF